ncbi:MAG: chemotaxis response regulator protein-glutamate methylesterase [Calditrichaeota bacterium]|nr:MAG: chemotaxis response regulator protein-glutamate methylesterase [Calditrichota bacterium]MBL1203982.1 chemotaxis response regulator protein-glutamate methylesterase [Calditrichota bacterium]NOG43813.1 chemotaxis response regulator protein-glutamate methylesterase [Calditrichota bacterium]
METRVLVVDDSALVRDILSRGLSMKKGIKVVGAASDPFKARDMIVKLRPDVLTLDVEMPRMDGLQFLKKLMPQYPLPVVMVSSLTDSGSNITLDALSAGAVDFVCKPSVNLKTGLMGMMNELSEKVSTAATVDVSKYKNNNKQLPPQNLNVKTKTGHFSKRIIAIGASTGGTEALRRVISALPSNYPGIVIVQHMPEKFTKMFADRLNEQSNLTVKEAVTGDLIENGKVLIAPGGLQTQLIKGEAGYKVVCRSGLKVCGHRPSVDVLFRSVARFAGKNAIGIMLTGMGSDGADAMVNMRERGARTIAQDEKTSVVFGMPKEAYERGGAEELVPLELIPNKIKVFLEDGE